MRADPLVRPLQAVVRVIGRPAVGAADVVVEVLIRLEEVPAVFGEVIQKPVDAVRRTGRPLVQSSQVRLAALQQGLQEAALALGLLSTVPVI